MKTELFSVANIEFPITFYIGRTQQENHSVLDLAKPTDLWFHLADTSSCHVIAILPNGINRKERGYIIRRGALICKQNTARAASQSRVAVAYTTVQDCIKSDIPGAVSVANIRTIIV
jgi:predicted ribosome quality control (RQC) complex YloA/Tae2 family protein